MDKITGSSQAYQAEGVNKAQDDSGGALSKLVDAAEKIIGKMQQKTQDDIDSTKQQVEKHRDLQLAVNVTGQLDDAVNEALASIKSDGSSSSSDSSQSVQDSSKSFSPIKMMLKKNLVQNILDKSGKLDPSDPQKFEQDLLDIQASNKQIQLDISGQIQDAMKDLRDSKATMGSSGADNAIDQMRGSLNIMSNE